VSSERYGARRACRSAGALYRDRTPLDFADQGIGGTSADDAVIQSPAIIAAVRATGQLAAAARRSQEGPPRAGGTERAPCELFVEYR
jgi:hypothetical protein